MVITHTPWRTGKGYYEGHPLNLRNRETPMSDEQLFLYAEICQYDELPAYCCSGGGYFTFCYPRIGVVEWDYGYRTGFCVNTHTGGSRRFETLAAIGNIGGRWDSLPRLFSEGLTAVRASEGLESR
jgi:hypothetical protein